MATPIRMKQKKMNKIHLDQSGAQVISVVAAASDAASKGVSAQPANPLTPQETAGVPAVTATAMTGEAGTGKTLQAPAVVASSAGVVEAEVPAEAVEPSVKVDQKDTTQEAPTPAGLGQMPGAAPKPTAEAAKDPNAQKETTTPEQPNLGTPKVVGETE